MKYLSTLLCLAIIARLGPNVKADNETETCSVFEYRGSDDVDIKLAAILGIHGSHKGQCGAFRPQVFQSALAMKLAVHLLVNGEEPSTANSSLIPGVRIGLDLYDDCTLDSMTTFHAGTLAAGARGVHGCTGESARLTTDTPLAGVIGTTLSQTTAIVADVMRSTKVPVAGISATLAELGNKEKYPGFVRAAPSDFQQAKVVIELARQFQWSYIVGVHTDDNYGARGIQEVQRLAQEERICFSLVHSMSVNQEPSDTEMEDLVRNTLFSKVEKSGGTLGVVYFGLSKQFKLLLDYIERKRITWFDSMNFLSKIYWIVTDGVFPTPELARGFFEYKTKILVIQPPTFDLHSFTNYFLSTFSSPPDWLQGPWRSALGTLVREYYGCTSYNFTEESMTGCELEEKIQFTPYLPVSLDAVYLLVNLLKDVHSSRCNAPGVCDDMLTALSSGLLSEYSVRPVVYTDLGQGHVPAEFLHTSRQLDNVSGDFVPVHSKLYSIMANVEQDSFKEIGSYQDSKVNLYPEYRSMMPNSECEKTCEECLHIGDLKYQFESGDIILLGLFSIHWKSQEDPFECGDYRNKSKSYVAMQAFLSSVHYLRRTTGHNFGYLILDDCYNLLTAAHMLTKVLSGDLVIVDPKTGVRFDPSLVPVAIGAQSSPVTLASLPVLTNMNISMISYSSTNPEMDSRITYPFFSRTVSSDAVQSRAIMLILKELQVTYVGAIVIQNTYGLELYEQFRKMAELEHICVEPALKVNDKSTVENIVPTLREYRNKNIQVIVAFAMDDVASTILKAVEEEDVFLFIASEAWGPNKDILDGTNGERGQGALVMGASVSVQLDYGFAEHVQTLDPFQKTTATWLREFWQEQFKCDLPGGFRNIHNKPCVQSILGDPYFSPETVEEMVNSPLVVHTILATMSAGLAVSPMLDQREALPFDPEAVSEAIRQVKLTSKAGESIRPFLDSGNGNGGFQIYNIQQRGKTYDYVPVGVYKSTGGLDIDWTRVKFYDDRGNVIKSVTSSCLFRSECERVCREVATTSAPDEENADETTKKETSSSSSPSPTVIALACIVAILLVAVLIVIVLLLRYCRRKIVWTKDYLNGPRRPQSVNNYYDSTSSSSPVPPTSPPPNVVTRTGHTNHAFSDILPPHDALPEPRNRSQSLPQRLDEAAILDTSSTGYAGSPSDITDASTTEMKVLANTPHSGPSQTSTSSGSVADGEPGVSHRPRLMPGQAGAEVAQGLTRDGMPIAPPRPHVRRNRTRAQDGLDPSSSSTASQVSDHSSSSGHAAQPQFFMPAEDGPHVSLYQTSPPHMYDNLLLGRAQPTTAGNLVSDPDSIQFENLTMSPYNMNVAPTDLNPTTPTYMLVKTPEGLVHVPVVPRSSPVAMPMTTPVAMHMTMTGAAHVPVDIGAQPLLAKGELQGIPLVSSMNQQPHLQQFPVGYPDTFPLGRPVHPGDHFLPQGVGARNNPMSMQTPPPINPLPHDASSDQCEYITPVEPPYNTHPQTVFSEPQPSGLALPKEQTLPPSTQLQSDQNPHSGAHSTSGDSEKTGDPSADVPPHLANGHFIADPSTGRTGVAEGGLVDSSQGMAPRRSRPSRISNPRHSDILEVEEDIDKVEDSQV